jgi:glutathionylspermidine synthase
VGLLARRAQADRADRVSAEAYPAFAQRLVEGGIVNDPWIDGQPRFREAPLILAADELAALYRAAEEVAAVYDELCAIVAGSPALLGDFFGLTPWQQAMWLASAPRWHAVARADVFVTEGGLSFAELNCDTPTGEAEAVTLGALAAAAEGDSIDPNHALGERFVAMVELLGERVSGAGAPLALGLVYPTELTEDLALVRLYQRWFAARGHEIILGSPYNLSRDARGLRLFDRPISLMLRHYKADWWGERASAWDDEQILDTEPLERPLRSALSAALDGRVEIVNPFGAVLPQNKRSMAFMWEEKQRFSPQAQATIARHIPVSSRLEAMDPARLLAERASWVLKSDYGAEGDEVILGNAVSGELWQTALARARKGRWMVQRCFEARRNAQGEAVNHGVYLVAGEACGIYARVSTTRTDTHALSVPVLVRP